MEILLTNEKIENLNLTTLMRAIRAEEQMSPSFWRSQESWNEKTVIYLDGVLMIDTERNLLSIEYESTTYPHILDIQICDPEKREFARNQENVFEGTFFDACKYILDWKTKVSS